MALGGKYAFVKYERTEEFSPRPDGNNRPTPPNRENSTLEIVVDGKNVTLTNTMSDGKTKKTEFEIGKEFEETMGPNLHKSVGSLDGNVLTVSSKSPDGSTFVTKSYTPSAAGLEVTYKFSKGGEKLIFKRQ